MMCEPFTWGTKECCETACTHFCPLELALSCLKQHLITHAAKRAHEEAEQKKQQRADSRERERVADAHPACAHAEDGEDLLGQAASYRAREATSGRVRSVGEDVSRVHRCCVRAASSSRLAAISDKLPKNTKRGRLELLNACAIACANRYLRACPDLIHTSFFDTIFSDRAFA
jgi:hypothetical protein